jgi:hypothetical protein
MKKDLLLSLAAIEATPQRSVGTAERPAATCGTGCTNVYKRFTAHAPQEI